MSRAARPPLTGQLDDPYTVDLSPGTRTASGPLAPDGSVVLLSRAVDAEFTGLERALAVAGVPVLRVNADLLAGLRVNGRRWRPTVSWVRRFARTAMPSNTAADVLAGDSWSVLVDHLAARARFVLPGPPIGQLDQLAGAERLGLRLPRWVVTGSPRNADLGDPVVVKALGAHFVEPRPGVLYGAFARSHTRSDLKARPDPGFPVLVQEYVPHQAEYRVYVVDGTVIGYLVGKDAPTDPWLSDSVTVRRVTLPGSVVSAALRLARAWRLRYSAFDFLYTDGSPVFLEANLDGDWRWFEDRADDRSVSAAVAGMVENLHRRAGGVVRPGLGLLTFLAGPAR